MENKGIFEVFFRVKPFTILNIVRNSQGEIHAAKVAKQAGCTYSHTRKILLFLGKKRLLTFDKRNKKHTINLTEKGNQVAEHIGKIIEIDKSISRMPKM